MPPRDGAKHLTPPQTPNGDQGHSPATPAAYCDDEDLGDDQLLLDPSQMLQFTLPTSMDMRISYGAGLGGMNRERERKYQPSIPPEYLTKLDFTGGAGSIVSKIDWDRTGESE